MAKFVEWSDVSSLGIEEIDAQHKVLVGRIIFIDAGVKPKLKKKSWASRMRDHLQV